MTIIRVRLDGEDRKRYGGEDGPLPEELVLDTEALKDMPAGELMQLERDTDLVLAALVPNLEPLNSLAVVRRAAAFLAVRLAGRDIKLADFQPRLLRAEFVQEDGVNPPAGPSGSSSGD